ncbi:MAG: hypothetical protein ACOCYD_00970, partial [bacterium]
MANTTKPSINSRFRRLPKNLWTLLVLFLFVGVFTLFYLHSARYDIFIHLPDASFIILLCNHTTNIKKETILLCGLANNKDKFY